MTLWTPSNLTTPPICWLKADSLGLNDGDLITTWLDSSSSHNAVGSGSTRPIFKQGILNGLPVVRMDGGKQMLVTNLGSALSLDDTYTVFILSHPTSVVDYPIILTCPPTGTWSWILEYNTDGGFYWGQQSPNYRLYDTNTHGGDIDLLSITKSAATSGKFYKNGIEVTTFGTNGSGLISAPSMVGDMLLGQYTSAGFGFTGDFAEIIICDTTLDITNRQTVEGYLSWKWGQQSSLPSDHPYKLAAPTIASNSQSNMMLAT